MIKHGRFLNSRRLISFFFSVIDDGKANFRKQHIGISGQTLQFAFIPLTVTVWIFFSWFSCTSDRSCCCNAFKWILGSCFV